MSKTTKTPTAQPAKTASQLTWKDRLDPIDYE